MFLFIHCQSSCVKLYSIQCSVKYLPNFQHFLLVETPTFLTQFYKLQSPPPNMWQSLVTIGRETSEIRRRKSKKEDRNNRGIL